MVKKSCGCKPCCRLDDPKEEMSAKTDLGKVMRDEISYRDVTFRPDLKVRRANIIIILSSEICYVEKFSNPPLDI